ncbi:MAG: hypothetical protein Q9177_000845 [Variospora cf. flavescens]
MADTTLSTTWATSSVLLAGAVIFVLGVSSLITQGCLHQITVLGSGALVGNGRLQPLFPPFGPIPWYRPASRAAFYFLDCWSMLRGDAHVHALQLHTKYGGVVRIMPNSLSFNTAQAWKDIYGTRLGKGQLAKDPIVFQQDGPTNIIVANHSDHARIRKLLSHAFSETALREQEPILMYYFHLLVSKLKEQMDGPAAGKVDIMSWYNFTTFDIIGNMFQSIKFLGIMRFAAHYPAIDRVFKLLLSAIPSVADLRKSHFDFTRKNTESRLDRNTDRKDFTTYVRLIPNLRELAYWSRRSSVIMTSEE